jgi:hypothetical protein
MALTIIAARLRQVAANIETLPPKDRERDIPDFVPELVRNARRNLNIPRLAISECRL